VDVITDLSDYPHREPAVSPPAALPQQTRPHQKLEPARADREERQSRFVAASRIRRLAISPSEQRANGWTPERIVDHRTAMADARIALCVVQGNTLDDIDPASGYSMSQASYDATRQSWISSMKFHGFNPEYDQTPLDKAIAYWAERRPQYLAGDDWLAAGLAAHRDYWQAIGHSCSRGSCDEHGAASRPAC
jgi:hypothetical protein